MARPTIPSSFRGVRCARGRHSVRERYPRDCARIITVQADEDLRVHRAAHRLGVAPDEIRNRIQRQWTDKKRAQHAHFALDNNAENALLPQVLQVHERLLKELSGRK